MDTSAMQEADTEDEVEETISSGMAETSNGGEGEPLSRTRGKASRLTQPYNFEDESDGEGGLRAKKKPKRSREELDAAREARQQKRNLKRREERRAIALQKQEAQKGASAQAEARLQYLLGQSALFGHFGKGLEERQKKTEEKAAKKSGSAALSSSSSSTPAKRGRKGRREKDTSGDGMDDEERELLADQLSDDELEGESKEGSGSPARKRKGGVGTYLTSQPSIITGGKLRAYQLEGLNWIIHLLENGLNGILADEMGLGKTLQSVSVIAYMTQFKKEAGPHLVMVPKSTISNWMREFNAFCPSIRVQAFHGSKDERERFVQKTLLPGSFHEERTWDVIVTTYEVTLLEKFSLFKIPWKFLIIDEAHRLKNEASQFSQVVRQLDTQHRLLLTGTPLQNNLHELWALLNFLLPDVFASAEQFDEWFNLDVDDKEAKQRIIGQLHKLLRPFMLRRLKADVEKSLPPKTETIIFAGMSSVQKELYKKILMRDIHLINQGLTSREQAGKGGEGGRTAVLNIVMQLRKCVNHPYLFPGIEDRAEDPLGPHLYQTCGKMVLLNKLLKRLKERGHRVLLFSQMTKMLDIIEDYMVSQGYQYCRIDGNTSHDLREDSINTFNAENSSKFCFLLSTRAGGLGINLQTADTVIIYDSDWNPQADLQAQDRAHRIGQKKPVQIFRLVTEDSVEVKVLERAQQKLKLDAMVVQQGRLLEKEKKMSKAELLDTVRFGADKIFRSKESSISDADIDLILEEGRKKTEEMNETLVANDTGDLYDFRLDGGVSAQQYEGVDYGDKMKREQKANMHSLSMPIIDTGKRERKTIINYNDEIMGELLDDPGDKKKLHLPKHMRIPKMEDWQFYNKTRLREIHTIEVERWVHLQETDQLPLTGLCHIQVLSPEMIAEKKSLIAAGFGNWSKQQYNAFIRGSARHGREAYFLIAREVGKPSEEVEKYAKHFWQHGEATWGKLNFDDRIKVIEKGERRIEEVHKLEELTATIMEQFENPWEEMHFRNVSMAPAGVTGRGFTQEEDRFLLCLAHLHGNGAWRAIKRAVRRSESFRFHHWLQAASVDSIGRRCEALMKLCGKEIIKADLETKVGELQEQSKAQTQLSLSSSATALNNSDAGNTEGLPSKVPAVASMTSQASMSSFASSASSAAADGITGLKGPSTEALGGLGKGSTSPTLGIQKESSKPLDIKQVGDLVSKLDASCKEVTSARMYQNVMQNASSIKAYHRALVETIEGSVAASELPPPAAGTEPIPAALALAAAETPKMPAGQTNRDLARAALLSHRAMRLKRSNEMAAAVAGGGKSATSNLSSTVASDEVDSWDRVNMTAVSHTLSHQSAATGVEDGKDGKSGVGIDGKPKPGRKKGEIPDGVLPRLAKLLVASKTLGVTAVSAHFLKWYPQLTKRQVDFKIGELAVKEKLDDKPRSNKMWQIRPEWKYLLEMEAVDDKERTGNREGAKIEGAFSLFLSDTRLDKRIKNTPKTGFQAFVIEKFSTLMDTDKVSQQKNLARLWEGLSPAGKEQYTLRAQQAQDELQAILKVARPQKEEENSATTSAPAHAPAHAEADAPTVKEEQEQEHVDMDIETAA